MDLVERLAKPGGASLQSGVLYAAKDSLAALHRRVPPLRGPLTAASTALRRLFGWVTTYEQAEVCAKLNGDVHHRRRATGRSASPSTRPVCRRTSPRSSMMNEQGGASLRPLHRCRRSRPARRRDRHLGRGDGRAARASSSTAHKVAFSLGQVEGARLSRGRELVGSRLAWSGFGYSLPPALGGFAYEVRIERTP